MGSRDWESMIHRHLDGIATNEEVAALSEQLERDSNTRLLHLSLARIHATLAVDDFQELPIVASENRYRELIERIDVLDTGRRFRRLVISIASSAAVVLLVAGIYFLRPHREPKIARITSIDGAIQWTGPGGQVSDNLASGQQLTGGTLESLSVDSLVELRFLDGSIVTTSGLSLLTISDNGQKVLHLREGNLSANVEPQPDHPLLIRTSTVELTVLSTQFDITANLEQTAISVNEGLVRAKRQADAKPVEIPAGHRAVASLDAANQLIAKEIGVATESWTANLEENVKIGRWVSAEHALGQRLRRAVSLGEMTVEKSQQTYRRLVVELRNDMGSIWAMPMPLGKKGHVAYVISLEVSNSHAGPVRLSSSNRFRIQGHIREPAKVKFGFSAMSRANTTGTRWVKAYAVRQLADSFDIELPIADFYWVEGDSVLAMDGSPMGRELVNFFCLTSSRETALEITHVELLEPERSEDANKVPLPRPGKS